MSRLLDLIAPYWRIGVGLLALVALGAVWWSGYRMGGHAGRAEAAQVRAQWAAAAASQAADLALREAKYRKAEQDARQALTEAHEANQHEIDRLQMAVDRERRSGIGLRSQFAAFAAESARTAENCTTEQGRAAARARADLQAELFGRIDDAAGAIAAEAGRYRAAGHQCQREHEVARQMIDRAAGRALEVSN